MKITLNYSAEEQADAMEDLAILQLRHPSGKLRKCAEHTQRKTLYFRSAAEGSRSLTPCDFCANVDWRLCWRCPAKARNEN